MADREHAAETSAREATDRLALALEDAGFDVGRDFPNLSNAVDRVGVAVVRLGDVLPATADRLAMLMLGAVLAAAQHEGDANG